jgi:hypothetical protein
MMSRPGWPTKLRASRGPTTKPGSRLAHQEDGPQPGARKRIHGKTRPCNTTYADVLPEGTRLQQLNRRAKAKAVKAANAANLRAAHVKGQATMAASLERANALADRHGRVDEDCIVREFEASLHPSHQLKAVHGQPEAVFCGRCGAYNNGGPLRGLKAECSGFVAPSHASQHRLLSCGIMPATGARLPNPRKRRRVSW